MTDTPTDREAVERHTDLMGRYNLWDAVKCMDALLAAKESAEAERDDLAREVAAYEDLKAQSDAAGGPNVLRRQLELRRYKVRAEAAEAERDRLREALRPFVEYVHDDLRAGSGTYTFAPAYSTGGGWIGAEDLRRARAALTDTQEDPSND